MEFVYTEEVTGEIVNIPIGLLHHHPDNPRKDLGDLAELTASIKAKGVMQNLTVVCNDDSSGYIVVIGNRRMEAAKAAGLETLPCIIAKMTPAEQVQTMLLENMQRSDLTAFEQAQGFQMMMDFGDSIETVAEKTGFSKTTIRRRLEMAKLNAATLKTVSSRQVDMGDYDKLSQIDDIDTRNAVLAEIGTNNFNNALKKALDAQKAAQNKVEWNRIFKSHGLTEIPYSDVWVSTYENLGYLEGTPDEKKVAELCEKHEHLYFAWGYNSIPYIRTDRQITKEDEEERAEKIRISEQEQEKRELLYSLAKRAFELRFDFIKNYSIRDSKKNIEKIADWMMLREIVSMLQSGMFSGYSTVNASKERYKDLFGGDFAKIDAMVDQHPEKALLMAVYAQWCDGPGENCYDYSLNYSENEKLQNLYWSLGKLGYEMSDEEKQMIAGTHPLYKNASEALDTEDDAVEQVTEQSDDSFDADIKSKLHELLSTFDSEDSENE